MKKLSKDLSIILPRLLIIGAILVLTFIIGNILFNQITSKTSDKNALDEENAKLTLKLNSLKAVQSSAIQVDAASTALPGDDPSLLALSQIERAATSSALTITNASIGGGIIQAGLGRSDISLYLSGDFKSVNSFITDIEGSAPLMKIIDLKSNTANSQTQAILSISVYWAPYPKQLPALTDNSTTLSDEEKGILTKLSGLTKPSQGKTPTPQAPSGRTNPFTATANP